LVVCVGWVSRHRGGEGNEKKKGVGGGGGGEVRTHAYICIF